MRDEDNGTLGVEVAFSWRREVFGAAGRTASNERQNELNRADRPYQLAFFRI